MVCDKESLHPFKKERGIRPLTVKLGIAFRSDMSSKETLPCAKLIFFYITKEKIRIIGDRLIDPKE